MSDGTIHLAHRSGSPTGVGASTTGLWVDTNGELNLTQSSGSSKSIGKDIGARAHNNANQAISHNTWTSIGLNSERWDTDNIHDNSTNNSRLTCKTAGKYIIVGQIEWEARENGDRYMRIYLNNETAIASTVLSTPDGSITDRLYPIVTIYNLSVNDYVELQVFQTSGDPLNSVFSVNKVPEFMMQMIAEV